MAIDRADDDDAPLAKGQNARDLDARDLDARDRAEPVERHATQAPEDRDRGTYGDQLRASESRATQSRGGLDAAADAEVNRGCERIREVEEKILTPAMLRIEAADPTRHLVGLDCRLKGEDRLKEKVADLISSRPGLTADQALSALPDSVRFTFVHSEKNYARGTLADIERLRAEGFELVKPPRNTWTNDQYKGINAQWRDTESGQRFEVQFHTEASYEAKGLTHAAYERVRDPLTPDAERGELARYQRQICAKVPIPPGAADIRLEDRHG